MERCIASGRRVAVVSNNSEACIREYLDLHRMTDLVSAIVGRPYATPHGMKPHPRIIHEVLVQLRLGPDSVVLIGDSVTDVQAAQRAHVASIGYANKPGKDVLLAGAGAVVEDMNDIATALDKLAGDAA
jgi:phosphoglycolate phosphatase-like HAD superfamily hydrolase